MCVFITAEYWNSAFILRLCGSAGVCVSANQEAHVVCIHAAISFFLNR